MKSNVSSTEKKRDDADVKRKIRRYIAAGEITL